MNENKIRSTIYIDGETYKRLKIISATISIPISTIIENMAKEYVKRKKK